MGFHVDYSGLDQLYAGIYGNAGAWNSAIASLSETVKALTASSNMAGAGADHIKAYFDSVHNTVIPVLNSLLTAHVNNCLLYVRDYQSGIDTSLHAVIDEDELRQIKHDLVLQEENEEGIDAAVQRTIYSVSDLVNVSCTGFSEISDHNSEIRKLIDRLLTGIYELENAHEQSDFVDTSQLIASLNTFISEQLANARSYKADFSVEAFAQSASFIALAQAYVAVNAQIEANQAAVSQAIEEENSRIEVLNAEAEKRQQEAHTEKLLVTGLCVIGSIAAIAAIALSGGTATPLVVGAVSAVSGAVIAGNNAAADEYAAHGWDTGKWDVGNIGTSAVLGGISGFITGYVGAGVSGSISNGLSSAGSTLLNSSSMAVRVGSNAVIGSTSQVISGVASRGATTFVTTMITSGGDVKTSVDTAWDSATNAQQILIDAATGGVSGGIRGLKKPTTVNTIKAKKDYRDDLLERSEFSDTIDDSNFKNTWEVRTAEETKEMRGQFNDIKDELISQWEERTGKTWPTYDSEVYSESGKILRKPGNRYDAHHIQPLTYGGSNTASNITPLHALQHYDHKGIHAPNTPYSLLNSLLKG